MIPSWDHVGTPSGFDGFLHFDSSTTSGTACWMRKRIRASILPCQSGPASVRPEPGRGFAAFFGLAFRVAGFFVLFFAAIAPPTPGRRLKPARGVIHLCV